MITLSKVDIQKQARRHHEAEQQRKQISPVTNTFPYMTIADAYEIQSEWMKLKLEEGRSVVGHKIGLTSKVMPVSYTHLTLPTILRV